MKYAELELSTKIILKIIFAGLALVFLWEIRDIIVLLLLAVIIASALEPLVDYLQQHKIPRTVSVLAVYVCVLILVGLAFYFIIPLLVSQFKILIQKFPEYVQDFNTRYGNLLGTYTTNDLFGQFISGVTGGGSNVIQSTFGLFGDIIAVVSVLVISFYLVAEKDGMKRFVSSLIPTVHHHSINTFLEKMQKKMGLWILGQVIASVVMFLVTWAGLELLHVQYALVLAVIAGLLEVVPYIGPILSAVPAMFFALVQGSPGLMLAVAILYLVLHELEGYVLIPKIMEKTVGGSPLAILLGILIGYQLYGVLGIVIAVPI